MCDNGVERLNLLKHNSLIFSLDIINPKPDVFLYIHFGPYIFITFTTIIYTSNTVMMPTMKFGKSNIFKIFAHQRYRSPFK